MRPLAGDDVFASRHSRTNSGADSRLTLPSLSQPSISCFLADEKGMEESLERSAMSASQRHLADHMKRSNYGVESMANTISSPGSQDGDDAENHVDRARKKWKNGLIHSSLSGRSYEDMSSAYSPSERSLDASRNTSPSETRRTKQPLPSMPITPSLIDSPMLSSIHSGRSRRNSEFDLSDTGADQDVAVGGEDKDSMADLQDSLASQLVMPSLSLPSRRPFTESGKNMGRFKVLIAGDSCTYPFTPTLANANNSQQ
jgi:hypothetical protein